MKFLRSVIKTFNSFIEDKLSQLLSFPCLGGLLHHPVLVYLFLLLLNSPLYKVFYVYVKYLENKHAKRKTMIVYVLTNTRKV